MADSWDNYFRVLGCDLEKLDEPHALELKFGEQHADFAFSVKDYLVWYISGAGAEAQKTGKPWAFDLGRLVEKWFNPGALLVYPYAYSDEAYFGENQSRSETRYVKTGTIVEKTNPTNVPARDFLLFEDESMTKKDIPVDKDDAYPNAVFSTGRRIIFDESLASNNTAFAAYNKFGRINLEELLGCFNRPSVHLLVNEHCGKDWEDCIMAVANEPNIEYGLCEERVGLGPGAIIGVKTGEFATMYLAREWVAANNSRKLIRATRTFNPFPGKYQPLEAEFKKATPTDITDIMGMRLFAAKNGFLKSLGCEKKPAYPF